MVFDVVIGMFGVCEVWIVVGSYVESVDFFFVSDGLLCVSGGWNVDFIE